MRARVSLITIMCAAGCYLEGTVGVTPGMNQQLTDFSQTTMTNTHAAWTVGLATGFYLDHVNLPHVGIGYSHPAFGSATTSGPAQTPELKTSGHHLRLDVDIPIMQIPTRLTASYTTVSDVTVDATGTMTATSSPAVPNGKLDAKSASGRTVFFGLTAATKRRMTGFAVMGSVGLSYISATTAFRENSGHVVGESQTAATIPGVSQSGVGVQARVLVMWGPEWPHLHVLSEEERKVLPPPVPYEVEKHTEDPNAIKPLPTAADPVRCRDAYGGTVTCP